LEGNTILEKEKRVGGKKKKMLVCNCQVAASSAGKKKELKGNKGKKK